MKKILVLEEAMKETDRIELKPLQPVQGQSPKGKKGKVISTVLFGVVVAVWVSVRAINRTNHRPNEEPFPIRVGEVTVMPGETTVGALSDAGYELAVFDSRAWSTEEGKLCYQEVVEDLTAEAKPRDYYLMALLKDGEDCAVLQIYNWSGGAAPVKEWTIGRVEIASYHEGAEQAALIGIPFSELTQEGVTQSADKEPESSEQNKCVWRNGAYYMSIEFGDDAAVERIQSEYDPH